uniref:proton-translocating NAD(P)(+) transhydrogenase n=1 Tax=Megaselia scalaris TaxID=36166 RepID=T1GQP9_MEGSC
MKPGSVIVDLAAEQGGNVETTVPGKVVTVHDVVHIGITDFPSRLPTQSSSLYANNISKFLLSIGEKNHFNINLNDEVVRGSVVLHNGQLLWPPPAPSPPPVQAKPVQSENVETLTAKPVKEVSAFRNTLNSSLVCTAGLSTALGLGAISPNHNFTTMVTVFGLSGIVVTNAISGITAVGGLLLMGGGLYPSNQVEALSAAAAFVSFINIGGGFLITQRMLDMFKRPGDQKEYNILYGIPALMFLGGYGWAAFEVKLGLHSVSIFSYLYPVDNPKFVGIFVY